MHEEPDPLVARETLVKWFLRTWTAIGMAILLVGALVLLARISTVLTPFIFALLVVFILRRPVSALSARGFSRSAAVGLWYLVGALVVTFVGVFVVPPLIAQGREFITDFPGYYEAASRLWFRFQVEYTSIEIPAWLQDAVLSARESITGQLTAWSQAVASTALNVGGRLIGFVVNIFLALALAFFVLKDLPALKDELLRLGGAKRRDSLLEVLGRITIVVEGWLRGQSMIALIVGVLTWLGLQFLGVPYALIIGIIAGITNFIPYLGPVVGGIIAAISAAFVSPQLVVYTVIWIVILQQAESMFLQPRIMSEQVNIHPVLVIFALLIGAQTAGIAGMVLALPIAGVLNVLFVYYFERHTASELATEEGALFRKVRCPEGASEPCEDEVPDRSPVEPTDEERE
ncbi:MAG: AI-2E family transporter [Coriobacteriia bacterium]|nr:AI-2E family transporter [Coriobacteriia bacterium]